MLQYVEFIFDFSILVGRVIIRTASVDFAIVRSVTLSIKDFG